jgi:hypothetical protein
MTKKSNAELPLMALVILPLKAKKRRTISLTPTPPPVWGAFDATFVV